MISENFILNSLNLPQHGADLELAAQWLKIFVSGEVIPVEEYDEIISLANRFFIESKIILEATNGNAM